MTNFTKAQSIDEVIDQLDDIIKETKAANDPLGYFPALYRLVTIEVKKGIQTNFFNDGPRMEKLDIVFANRYLSAYRSYKQGGDITSSWAASFALSTQYWPIVLQHLLIGMNAHINLDLGIAASEVMKGQNINELEDDFNKINKVLSSLVHKVQQDLAEIWPAFRVILKLTGKVDDLITDFSMQLARDGAWKFACELASMPGSNQTQLIKQRDKKVADKARIITNPGWLASSLFKVIRLAERGSVSDRISILRED